MQHKYDTYLSESMHLPFRRRFLLQNRSRGFGSRFVQIDWNSMKVAITDAATQTENILKIIIIIPYLQ